MVPRRGFGLTLGLDRLNYMHIYAIMWINMPPRKNGKMRDRKGLKKT